MKDFTYLLDHLFQVSHTALSSVPFNQGVNTGTLKNDVGILEARRGFRLRNKVSSVNHVS